MYASQPRVASSTLRRATGCAVAFALIALVSCGGDDFSNEPAPAPVTPPAGGTGVTGNAYLGPIAGATASLFTVNPNGTNTGAAIETVTTTATGFAFTNAVTGPTRICVAGGTYLDEATNATQTNTMTLCALVGGATTEVFITPMSSFVDEIVKAQLKLIAAPTAADFTAALTAANDLVKSVYNVANPVDTLKPLFEKAEATAHPLRHKS